MNKTTWSVWLCNPYGYRVQALDNIGAFTVSRIANGIGTCSIILPPDFDKTKLVRDAIIEFWRKPPNGVNRLFSAYFLRRIAYANSGGRDVIEIGGQDFNYLLSSRIIAYAAGSAQSEQTNQADTIVMNIVSQNLGSSATDSDRNLGSTYLTSPGYGELAQSLTRAFAWRNALTVCQELAEASRERGTELYFWVEPTVSGDSLIATFHEAVNRIGVDHTSASNQPVFFGAEFGNLDNARLTYDYTDEVSVVYAGGAGEESNREVVECEDTGRSLSTPWARREAFEDCRQETSTTGITDRGKAALEAGRPRVRFEANLRDSEQYQLGNDWGFGDEVTCSAFGQQFDGMIKALSIYVDGSGNETIDCRIEVEVP